MDKLVSCKLNIDTACVELQYTDESILSINCIAVENEFGYSPHARAELDWLIYNDPLSYAQTLLDDKLKEYLKSATNLHNLALDGN